MSRISHRVPAAGYFARPFLRLLAGKTTACFSGDGFRCLLLAALLVFLLAGCSGGDTPAQNAEQASAEPPAAGENQAATDAKADDQLPEQPAPRTTMPGRWMFVLTQQEQGQLMDHPLLLIEVSQDENEEYTAEITANSGYLGEATLESAEITDDTAHMVFGFTGITLDLQGKIVQGFVFGTAVDRSGTCQPTYLIPTELTTLEDVKPQRTVGSQALDSAVKEGRPADNLKKIAELIPRSPTAMFAYQMLIDMAREEDLDADAVEQAAAEYLELAQVWGPRMVERARINVGILLAQRHHVPEVALKWLDEAESNLTEEHPRQWKEQIELARMDLLTGEALLKINDGTEQEREDAVKIVRDYQDEYGDNRLIQYALALYDEKTGKIGDAIAGYTRLAVLPLVEAYFFQQTWMAYYKQLRPPSVAATRLWKEKHGNTKGLKEHIDKTYQEAMEELVAATVQPPADQQGTRNVLCEFFTGSMCQPCVAADVALDALASTYPEQRVIVLRYHQHIPGPDPLTNEDALARFQYYRAVATPTVVVNGKVRNGVGGPSLALVGHVYQRLRHTIDPFLAEQNEVNLSATANAANGVISVSVDAEGLTEPAETVRLRVVLAEKETTFNARNGIRRHEMLVRAMPGGTAGIKPENGRFDFKREIEVGELRQQLNDYLLAYEQVHRMKFSDKPLELRELHLVAFLQDDRTGEVLHATSVPVTGELEPADAS